MKFFQVSDLHIGKRLMEQSMLEDQQNILNQIIMVCQQQRVDALLICGDIYDKSVPSEEAVRLFDSFLNRLVQNKISTYLISGNHDSPERLHFASGILSQSGIHIVTGYDGSLAKFCFKDSYGAVNLYLLPFIKPVTVARYFENRPATYHEAVKMVMEKEQFDPLARNVLMAHQFVTAGDKLPDQSDSEQISVGGVDNVDISALEMFDYVALGHLHNMQAVGRQTVCYSGSPLRYSFSEASRKKGGILITLNEKENTNVCPVYFDMPVEMGVLRGNLADLINSAVPGDNRYIEATLTDREPLYDAVATLRKVYPNLLSTKFETEDTARSEMKTGAEDIAHKTPKQLFCELFELQNQTGMTEREEQILDEIWEELL